MKSLLNTQLRVSVGAVAAACVVSCSSPAIKIVSEPIQGSQSSVLEPLERESRALLQREGLNSVFRKDTGKGIRELAEIYEREGGTERLVVLAERCLAAGRDTEADSPEVAAGYYLEAARLSRPLAMSAGASQTAMGVIYNDACASFATLFASNASASNFQGPLQGYQLRVDRKSSGAMDPNVFDSLVPADRIKFKDVKLQRRRSGGVGGAMIGHHPKNGRGLDDRFVSAIGYALPINAVLDFPRKGEAVVTLRDLMEVDTLREGGRNLPLAADWTASIAYLYRYAPKKSVGFLGMLDPTKYSPEEGLYRIQPFDPKKTPVILVHGLMSTPETWIVALNALRSDPVLRENYQAILFRYPTGYNITRNAASFRERLARFRETYDPGRSNRKMRNMVIVCHSMGGNLSDLQIRDSGDHLESLVLDRPVDELELDKSLRDEIRRQMVFEANPDIDRVVYLASPHRGSDLAISPIGKLGYKLIKLPGNILSGNLAIGAVDSIKGLSQTGRNQLTKKVNSIRSLSPDNPLFPVIDRIPVARGTTRHSIIGQANQGAPVEEGTDKVVEYWSSHLNGVASEKIVDATHTTITGDPAAIEEVRRILYKHIGRSAPKTTLSYQP